MLNVSSKHSFKVLYSLFLLHANLKVILHYAEYTRNVAATSLFLLLHMRKSFVYCHFPEMLIPLRSRNHFNFSALNKCRFLFKPIIF